MKVRPSYGPLYGGNFGFNSRTCEGATKNEQGRSIEAYVSIHAPVKVRLKLFNIVESNVKFQFTHL